MGSSSAESVLRSISLPSRLDSDSLHYEAELNKLRMRSWEPSSWSIQVGLVRLAEMYNWMAEAIQSLQKKQHGTVIEEALEGSVGLLDTCGQARDLILMMREQVQELQSALRRRRQGKDSSIQTKIHAYICFRKKAKKKIINKCLRTLKKMESNTDDEHDHDLVGLREVNGIAISVFRSLMEFLSETGAGGWSLVRKLVPKSGEQCLSEVGALDLAVQSVYRGMKKNGGKGEVGIVQERLERVDATMESLEEGLDCIFRCLIRNRVALLNVLTP